ncbi:MAG: hypothetical protein AABZ55_01110, partial [Bdellovibrionota bacterium]
IPKDQVLYIGSLKQYAGPCKYTFSDATCKVQYSIPQSLLNITGLNSYYDGIGLGFFLTEPLLKCSSHKPLRNSFGSTTSLLLDSYKIYKILPLGSLRCPRDDNIEILALNKSGIATQGQISSNAILASSEYLSTFKRSIEFFGASIYGFFFLTLFFCYLSGRLFLRSFLVQMPDQNNSYFEPVLLAWITFAAIKSGFIELIFLRISNVDILFRFQTAVSVIAHVTPIIAWCLKGRGYRTHNLVLALLIGYLPFEPSPLFNYYLIVTSLVSALIGFAVAIKRRELAMGLFCSFVLIEDAKAFSIINSPAINIALTFVTAFELQRILSEIKRAAHLAGANLWARGLSVESATNPDPHLILNSFLKRSPIGKATYLSLRAESAPSIYTSETTTATSNPIHLQDVPPIFAHVISTGTKLLHVPVNESFSKRLFRRPPISDLGSHFSILPVRDGTKLLGLLALSKYTFNPHNDEDEKLKLELILPLLSESLAT